MSTSTQKILKMWVIPGGSLKFGFDHDVEIAISEDKQWWFGRSMNFSKTEHEGDERAWGSRIYEGKHPDSRWEAIRQHIINTLLPKFLPPPPPYNDLDRFTDLEE